MGCASLLHTHGMSRQSAFCRKKPNKSKVSAILEEKRMCAFGLLNEIFEYRNSGVVQDSAE